MAGPFSRIGAGLLLADVTAGGANEGIDVSLKHSWPWPAWATLLLMIGLSLFVCWLYHRERGRVSRRATWLLALLRISLLGLVLFMMHGWVIDRHRTDLPDMVLVIDDSQSMNVEDTADNARQRNDWARRLERAGLEEPSRWNLARSLLLDKGSGWMRWLDARYRLKVYRLGGSPRPLRAGSSRDEQLRGLAPTESSSRLGWGLRRILEAQRGRPTAAIVLLTDGITTEGRGLPDVAQLARRRAVPLYIVGLGAEQPPRDVRLADLLVDDAVFVDDLVNFDVKLHHSGFANRPARVRLLDAEGQVLAERRVSLGGATVPQPVRLSYRPREAGTRRHVIVVSELPGEANRENNRIVRDIQVRDARIRVLLTQASPTYEFRALKHLLSRSVRRGDGEHVIELTTVLQDADFEFADQDQTASRVFPVSREELFAHDVLIFGDADPSYFSGSVMTNIAEFAKDRGGGVVFIAGPRFTPLAYGGTPLEDLFPIDLATASVPDPDEVLDTAFTVVPTPLGLESPYMQLGDARQLNDETWRDLPGLYWLLSGPDLRPGSRVLAEHASMITAGGDPLPVISMHFVGAGKVVFHATDETYRWASHLGDDLYHARYWLQLIRYLSRSKLLSDRKPAEILTDRERYRQGEAVHLKVRFRDERMAPTGNDQARLVLEAESGRSREIVLRRGAARRGEFATFVDDLDAGRYRAWLASPSFDERPPPRNFVVEPPAGELARLEMAADALREAAEVSRGKFYRLERASQLPADLPRGRQVRVEPLPSEPLWNSSWLAAAFVGLITAEWLLRKKFAMV